MGNNEKTTIRNTRYKDSGGKLIFENATLCSQFLRDYSGIEALKNVRPEDIEDMTERFIPMFTEERESDVVKKIRLSENEEIFLVTLIEHKSSVDYNVVMQMLRYMVFIWEDYENRMEAEHKGISKTKDFRYPPILPIIYYEDRAEWTAAVNLKDRIFLSEIFGDYLPDYRYVLFKLQEHEQAEFFDKSDEISLIMLINRLRSSAEYKEVRFPEGYLDNISKSAPEDVLRVLQRVVSAYLRELNLPEDEISDLTDQIKERKMGRLFEHFESVDIPAAREIAKKEGRAEGRAEGRVEGIAEGDMLRLIRMVCKKIKKGKEPDIIAEELDEEIDLIKEVCDTAEAFSPNYEEKEIYKVMKEAPNPA